MAQGTEFGEDDRIDESVKVLIEKAQDHARQIVGKYDGSHAFDHVQRVVNLAHALYRHESASDNNDDTPAEKYDLGVVLLGAWLHDVGDKKYLSPSEDSASMVRDYLLANGANPALADKVQSLCTFVSYSNELDHRSELLEVLNRVPELAIVQDADRLDALGAVGVGRCFAFGGAKGKTLEHSAEHLDEKLVRLSEMMKTATGKKWAMARTEKVKTFQKWWQEEASLRDAAVLTSK